MNKTQFIKELQDDLNLPRRDVVHILEVIEETAVKGLKKDGVVVIGNVARIKLVQKPAVPAGDRINPFTKEMQHYDRKPASKAVRVGVPKVLKDRVL